MADSFTPALRLCKPEPGADEGTWGSLLNDNTIDMIDEAVGGYVAVSVTSGNVTLSTNNGTTDQARNAVIKFTGVPGSDRTITAPDVEKTYWLINGVSDTTNILFKASGGSTITIPAGYSAKVYTDGATNAVILFTIPTGGNGVSTTATQTLTNKTLTSPTITTLSASSPAITGTVSGGATYSGITAPSPAISGIVSGGAAYSGITLSGTTTVSGGQLAFPSSQSASADANTLDDYEEGTFTPAIAFGGAAVGVTYGTQTGSYTKVGNRVMFTLHIGLTSKGSSTGIVTITGLPFTADAARHTYSVYVDDCTLTAGANLQGYTSPSSTTLYIDQNVAGNAADLSNAECSNTSVIIVSGSYKV